MGNFMRLSFIIHFKIEFLLPFTGCGKVLGKMPEKGLTLVLSPFIHYEVVWKIAFIKLCTICPRQLMKLHVLNEIFAKVYFIFMLRYLMTSQKCVFINVILCFFISIGGREKQADTRISWKQNKLFGWNNKNH